MKWFKHDSNASTDAKLKRIRIKYGMEGYGLYWYCLELIAKNVEKHNLTFSLEEDSELISADTGIHQERVEEMMVYMVNLELFEQESTHITCLKMASRADEYTLKLLRATNIQTLSGHSPDKVPPNRREENRREEKEQGGTLAKFAMSVGWKPDVSMWGGNCMMSGVSSVYSDVQLNEFILYWSGEQKVFTESQWQLKLINQLRRASVQTTQNNKNYGDDEVML